MTRKSYALVHRSGRCRSREPHPARSRSARRRVDDGARARRAKRRGDLTETVVRFGEPCSLNAAISSATELRLDDDDRQARGLWPLAHARSNAARVTATPLTGAIELSMAATFTAVPNAVYWMLRREPTRPIHASPAWTEILTVS